MTNEFKHTENDDKNTPRLVGGPFSSFTAPVTIVADRLKADGLSFPQIAVRLRRWAMARTDVLRVVLGHTGRKYTIAALLRDPTYEDLCEIQCQLTQFSRLLGGHLCEVYAFGPAHSNASVFTSFGHLIIQDTEPLTTTMEHD